MSYSTRLFTHDKKRLSVGTPLAKGGGEGTVFNATVEGQQDSVAFKRYHDSVLNDPDYQRVEHKIQTMVANRPTGWRESGGHVVLPWPTYGVFDNGRFVGFTMPKISFDNAAELHFVNDPSEATNPGQGTPPWLRSFNWKYRVHTALNMANAISVVHALGEDYVFGDFNFRNILVHSSTQVTLVDCDAIQVVDSSGLLHPVRKVMPGIAAPEMGTNRRNHQYSDLYTLALHIHQLLLAGERPFSGIWHGGGERPTAEAAAAAGQWVYASDDWSPRPVAPDISVLPQPIKSLFIRAFVSGAKYPAQRPTANEWVTALSALKDELKTCARHSEEHVYWKGASGCPWCLREQQLESRKARTRVVPRRAPAQTALRPAAPTPALKRTTTTRPAPTRPAPTRPAARRTPKTAKPNPPVVPPIAAGPKPNRSWNSLLTGTVQSIVYVAVYCFSMWAITSIFGGFADPHETYLAQPLDLAPIFFAQWWRAALVMGTIVAIYELAVFRAPKGGAPFAGRTDASSKLRIQAFSIAFLSSLGYGWYRFVNLESFAAPEHWWPVPFVGAAGFGAVLGLYMASRIRNGGVPAYQWVASSLFLAVVAASVIAVLYLPSWSAADAARSWKESSAAVLESMSDTSADCSEVEFDVDNQRRVLARGAVQCRMTGLGAVTTSYWARSGAAADQIVDDYASDRGASNCVSTGEVSSPIGEWSANDGAISGRLLCWRRARPEFAWQADQNDTVNIMDTTRPISMKRAYNRWRRAPIVVDDPSELVPR